MNSKLLPGLCVLAITLLFIGCAPSGSSEVVPTTEAQEAEPVSTATGIPPTETPPPADPIEISADETTDAGCVIVRLNTESWNPLSAAFNETSDPFYQFHDNEDGFYFNVELYTVYGAGWTGQTGTFDANCATNGICVYLVPDDTHPFLASGGEITVDELAQEDGALLKPAAFSLSNLIFEPVPGSSSEGCYFVESVSVAVEN